jgi:hypothetical protein
MCCFPGEIQRWLKGFELISKDDSSSMAEDLAHQLSLAGWQQGSRDERRSRPFPILHAGSTALPIHPCQLPRHQEADLLRDMAWEVRREAR